MSDADPVGIWPSLDIVCFGDAADDRNDQNLRLVQGIICAAWTNEQNLMPHSLRGAGTSHAGYSGSSRARARVRSIGKIKRFSIVTIFVGHRIARQPSALRTVVRPGVRLSIGQLVTAGRPPYFASRRYSVDRAIPRRRAACVRFPSQSRIWARIAWRSASRKSRATGGCCSWPGIPLTDNLRSRHAGRHDQDVDCKLTNRPLKRGNLSAGGSAG